VSSADRRPSLRARVSSTLTLRARVSLLVAIAAGFAVAIVSLAAFLTMRVELHRQLDSSLKSRAHRAAELQLDPESVLSQPTLLLLTADNKVFFVTDGGVVYANDRDSSFVKPLTSGPELAVAQGDEQQSLRTLRIDGVDYRVVAVASGPGQALVLARSMSDTTATLDHLGFVLLTVGVAGIIFASMAGLIVARAGLRPVERLTKTIEHITRTGELTPIDLDTDDELGRLARSFNSMLVALEISRTQQRQLVADAGHELRTPLTSLRTNLDLLAQSDAAGDRGLSAPDRAALLLDVRAQIEELSGLVADLVELARDDAPGASFEQLDFSVIVERAIERVQRRAVTVGFEVDLQPWILEGDANALERAVTNLLDNAVKWSPPGGRVFVRLASGRLYVADQGPGIADADLPYVFDRFYRSADARSMPGSGLGLAIVQTAAARHGGSVSAGRAGTGGALMVFELPGRVSDPTWVSTPEQDRSAGADGSSTSDGSAFSQHDAGASAT
jgi:two-component system sensor histidine kinase MprB